MSQKWYKLGVLSLWVVLSVTTQVALGQGGQKVVDKPTAKKCSWFTKKKSKEKGAPVVKVSHYDTLTTSANTKVESGLFKVIKKGSDYYFEIPDSLMGRELLVINKLQRVPAELNEAGVNRGINTDNFMIRFEYDPTTKSLMMRQARRMPSYPKGDNIGRSVEQNFISPLISKLKIEAYCPDSSGYVVKVNELFNGQKNTLNNLFDDINLGTSTIGDLSRILSVRSYTNNVVAYAEWTTRVKEGNNSVQVSVEVSTSLVLLPSKPMKGRFTNQKVGFFSVPQSYYSDSQQRIEQRSLLTRWRLEPSDTAAYMAGHLVEPKAPIVIWLDNTIPPQWRSWMKRGVEDWNVAFEKAGFKNAIIAKQLPDSISADEDDVNYSVLNYVASAKVNAMGPSIYDPRSGEIIEADIIWWHNVMTMLRNWITVQTGPVNPAAQQLHLPDSLMGDAMRFVACHEVGHSLGLRHNMIGSYAFATDSLRSKSFTDRMNSTSSSIMDYARYNYVAQPQDGVTALAPHIGPYDIFAIDYGYRWYSTQTPHQELHALDSLLMQYSDPLYRYGQQQDSRDVVDPRSQSEDLGDDAVRSSELGIANLRIVMSNLINWNHSQEPMQDYTEVGRLAYAAISQWNNYIYHVMASIGGIYLEPAQMGDQVESYRFVERAKQEHSLDFLLREGLSNSDWLFNAPAYKYTFPLQSSPMGYIEVSPSLLQRNLNSYIFWDILDNKRLIRMLEAESALGSKAFTVLQMLDKLHAHVFGATERSASLTPKQRVLQKQMVDALILSVSRDATTKAPRKLMEPPMIEPQPPVLCSCEAHRQASGEQLHSGARMVNFYGSQSDRVSDAISFKRGELLRIEKLIKSRLTTGDRATSYHYQDMLLRIQEALTAY